MKEIAAKQL